MTASELEQAVIHELKTWPEPFEAIWRGLKRYEIRRNDRDFKVGDFLQLTEYDPRTKRYSGRGLHLKVTYMTNGGEWGLPADLCVMSFRHQCRVG